MKAKMMKIFGVASFVIASLNACSGENGVNGQTGGNTGSGNVSYGTLVDERDGQTYRTTKIGDQVWMAENLNYAYLQPTAELYSSSFCYDNDPANCQKYGRLYQWSAAMRVCPEGWHLPSEEEFSSLLESLKLRRTQVITQKNLNAEAITEQDTTLLAYFGAVDWDGNGRLDYSALAAGLYDSDFKMFYNVGAFAYFWSSTESKGLNAYIDLSRYAYYLNLDDHFLSGSKPDKDYGYSVRCLQDSN